MNCAVIKWEEILFIGLKITIYIFLFKLDFIGVPTPGNPMFYWTSIVILWEILKFKVFTGRSIILITVLNVNSKIKTDGGLIPTAVYKIIDYLKYIETDYTPWLSQQRSLS